MFRLETPPASPANSHRPLQAGLGRRSHSKTYDWVSSCELTSKTRPSDPKGAPAAPTPPRCQLTVRVVLFPSSASCL